MKNVKLCKITLFSTFPRNKPERMILKIKFLISFRNIINLQYFFLFIAKYKMLSYFLFASKNITICTQSGIYSTIYLSELFQFKTIFLNENQTKGMYLI